MDLSAEKTKTSNLSLPLDTTFVRAIQYNSKTYKQFKKDKIYDYNNSKVKGYSSFWEMLRSELRRFFYNYFKLDLTEKQIKTVLWIVVAVVVVILFLIFYFFRPSFFYINKKKKIDFNVENEDIHDLDFERLIKEALKWGHYADAIRWNYLQILKALHTQKLISWDAHKTVIEYVYELKRPGMKPSFKEASQQFLYYRYGNFEASQRDWEEFDVLIRGILSEL